MRTRVEPKLPHTLATDAVRLVVARRLSGGDYEFSRVRTEQRLTNMLREVCITVDRLIERQDAKRYNIGGAIESDEYMLLPLAKGTIVGRTRQQVSRAEVSDPEPAEAAPTFRAKPDDPVAFRSAMVRAAASIRMVGATYLRARPVAFYALVRGAEEADRVAYVRHLNPMRLAKGGNIFATLGDTLATLTDEVFAMDNRADLVITAQQMYVLNKTFFDSTYFAFNSENKALEPIVRAVFAKLPIEAETRLLLGGLVQAKKRMRRKLLELHESGHLADVTIADFRKAVRSHGYAPRDFVQGGEIYASEENGEILLGILNEDFFEGALTGRTLAAMRKALR